MLARKIEMEVQKKVQRQVSQSLCFPIHFPASPRIDPGSRSFILGEALLKPRGPENSATSSLYYLNASETATAGPVLTLFHRAARLEDPVVPTTRLNAWIQCRACVAQGHVMRCQINGLLQRANGNRLM